MHHFFTIDSNKGPAWLRTLILTDAGEAFVPAAASGQSERAVFLRAAWDGIPIITHRRHLYAPLDWLAREFPAERDLWRLMDRHVAAARDQLILSAGESNTEVSIQ